LLSKLPTSHSIQTRPAKWSIALSGVRCVTSRCAPPPRIWVIEFLYSLLKGTISVQFQLKIMQLTRAADYAVRVMIYMAGLPSASSVRLRTIAAAVKVPESFLAKVMQSLTRAGMTTSRRGPDGGFMLPPASLQLTVLDVIVAIDGPVQLNSCLGECGSCARKSWCPAHFVWADAQIAMLGILQRDSLADLAHAAARNREALDHESLPVVVSSLN
jgi:Rrf2 family protein